MKINKYNIYLIGIFTLLSGCLKQEVIDDVQLVSALGFDLIDNETVSLTASYPEYLADKSIEGHTFTDTAPLSKEVRKKLNTVSSKPFVSGKIEVVLYSKELAKYGMFDYIDTLNRDPSIGARTYLGIVDGSTQNLLEQQFGQQDNGIFLSNLIEHEIKNGTLPHTNLHLFTRSYFQEGQDPFLPLIIKHNSGVKILGVALFKDGKMVGDITGESLFAFRAMYQDFSTGDSIMVKINSSNQAEADYASVYNIHVKRNIQIDKLHSSPQITISLEVSGAIMEYTGDKINKKVKENITQATEKKLSELCKQLMKQFQELKIDPIGIGAKVRSQDRNFDIKKWEDTYPNIEVKIVTKVDITESGIIK
ncbi:Ger(x)C family spore germination protein [Filobacillus milosensis]|uniref:Ger(X)C family spore germination protein n=1 Tax=Filobacillus milosensis TaxID=94137 RepID=A0A4Y8IEU9_9BACI|nr:Ger(x)C family spore germination protein [Filobacillus milosensis]TFB15070.1 Ger(x)C family spore germination protein [Filobacillus milosensis]